MMRKIFFSFFFSSLFIEAQQRSVVISPVQDSIKNQIQSKNMGITPLRAGIYSAILPGLGQYYNRKYWKIPIVLGAIGTSAGVTLWNQRQYERYRSAFLSELDGRPHEFSHVPGITKEALANAQERIKRQRDYAIGITAIMYLLSVVDAVVDAHLYDFRRDPDMDIAPEVVHPVVGDPVGGISFIYRF